MKLPINKIICGDCLEVMKDWSNNCIDLVLTDPPYGISAQGKVIFDHTGIREVNFGEWDLSMNLSFLEQVSILIKESGAVVSFFDAKQATLIWQQYKKVNIKPKQFAYWFKGYHGINPRKNFVSRVEVALWGVKSSKYYWGGSGNTVNLYIPKKNELAWPPNNYHPTQKTIDLGLWFINLFSKPNDIILDCFCGAGAFCIAAKILGRKYIGIDISEEYCEITRKRLKGVRPSLFENLRKRKIEIERANFGLIKKKQKKMNK